MERWYVVLIKGVISVLLYLSLRFSSYIHFYKKITWSISIRLPLIHTIIVFFCHQLWKIKVIKTIVFWLCLSSQRFLIWDFQNLLLNFWFSVWSHLISGRRNWNISDASVNKFILNIYVFRHHGILNLLGWVTF